MEGPIENRQRDDLRDYLAAERTLLAWIRTGLALMGFGFVVARFGLFVQQLQIAQHAPAILSYGLSQWFGTALIGASVLVNLLAGWHHLQLVRTINAGQGQKHSARLAVSTSLFLAVVGLTMAIYLVAVSGAANAQSENAKEVFMAQAAIAWDVTGRNAPLQRGQWLPHTAPDPEAHVGAPEDDGDVVRKGEPRKALE